MYIVDDPTLALIIQFIGMTTDAPKKSDSDFLYRQITAIQRHVNQFPEAERGQRTLEWIEANARKYRQEWQKRASIDTFAHIRCVDCPLACHNSAGKPCAIHSRWLALLQRYAADELSSHDYVAHSLELLSAHKAWLKVSRRHVAPQIPAHVDAHEQCFN